jgi:hypothetical protein
LVNREARRELKGALAHILGAEASLDAALIVDKHGRVIVLDINHDIPLVLDDNEGTVMAFG